MGFPFLSSCKLPHCYHVIIYRLVDCVMKLIVFQTKKSRLRNNKKNIWSHAKLTYVLNVIVMHAEYECPQN